MAIIAQMRNVAHGLFVLFCCFYNTDSGKKKRKLTILELEERNLSLENDKLQEEIEKLKDERQLIVAKKSYYDLKFQILCNNNPEVVAQMLKSNEC